MNKKMNSNNIYQNIKASKEELFDILVHNGNAKIERIVSSGQVSPKDFWYDEPLDEWIILIDGKAELLFENEEKVVLTKGDYLLIPSHRKHRVTYTSSEPVCIWLAVFFN